MNRNCFDELPQFLESQFRFLIGWARITIPFQRVRGVSCGNPPTYAQGEWVIRYWAPWLDSQHTNPAAPGERRWFAVIDGSDEEVEDGTPFEFKGDMITPKSRTFIPARLQDNPALMQTGYLSVLQGMPEPLRSQMLYGDFTAGLDDDPWQVIPTAWVRAAVERWKAAPKPEIPITTLGVDVARGGSDQTILAPRFGTYFAPLLKYAGSATPDGPAVSNNVVRFLTTVRGKPLINVDVVGVGSSAYDSMRAAGLRPAAINFGAAAPKGSTDKSGRLGFANLRAFAYWKLREALDPDLGDGLALPDDRELLADLTAPRWMLRAGGVQIEEKEEIRKRIGRSTDCGDAVALALLELQARITWA